MSALSHRTQHATAAIRPVGFAVSLALGLGLVTAASAGQLNSGSEPISDHVVTVAEADDEVILPSRVASAVARTQNALARSTAGVEERRIKAATRSLGALQSDVRRAYSAAKLQMNAAAAVDPEEEAEGTTAGPDSVVAVLTLDQATITGLAGLFDYVKDPGATASITKSLNAALTRRDQLLNTVIAMDPEGAGADYADGMADTVDGYTDETANLAEALKVDRLTPASTTALTNALARSQATAAKVAAAFGGGE